MFVRLPHVKPRVSPSVCRPEVTLCYWRHFKVQEPTSSMLGEKVACAAVSPHLYILPTVGLHSSAVLPGSCTSAQGISVMESVTSWWRLLQAIVILACSSTHNEHVILSPNLLKRDNNKGTKGAQWLERRIRDRNVPGSSPRRNGGRIFFFRVNFLSSFEWNDTVNWCMVVWCTQNLRRDGSSSTWHQPCNNQIALSVHHFGGYWKKKKKKKKTLQKKKKKKL